jgi:enamine deaminase RidA (YjgF/YER057c/UK114 family)
VRTWSNSVADLLAAGHDPRMAAHLIRCEGLYPAAPYAYVSVAPAGGLVFTAGACPIDDNGTVTFAGDFVRQAEHVMANLVIALAAAGASLGDVLKSTVYVASSDKNDLYSVWQVVQSAFGQHDPPSTLLGVTVLGYTGQLVEVEAVALGRHVDELAGAAAAGADPGLAC